MGLPEEILIRLEREGYLKLSSESRLHSSAPDPADIPETKAGMKRRTMELADWARVDIPICRHGVSIPSKAVLGCVGYTPPEQSMDTRFYWAGIKEVKPLREEVIKALHEIELEWEYPRLLAYRYWKGEYV